MLRYPIYHLGGVKCVARAINPIEIQPEKVWPTANFSLPVGLEPTTSGFILCNVLRLWSSKIFLKKYGIKLLSLVVLTFHYLI